jgi:hypothetical protein
MNFTFDLDWNVRNIEVILKVKQLNSTFWQFLLDVQVLHSQEFALRMLEHLQFCGTSQGGNTNRFSIRNSDKPDHGIDIFLLLFRHCDVDEQVSGCAPGPLVDVINCN